ncbi:MAG: ECF transporter S component, partial [Eubacteriales bacterium]|nr:ECF transporter S component [Eubacteriales bacterium]
WRYGAVAAGVGSALADLFLGYVHWIPWTLCIKALMAVMMGLIIEKAVGNTKNTLIAALSTVVIWLGFHFAVNKIIKLEAANNPSSLLSETVTDLSQLGVFLESVQSQLMIVALAIPVFLIVITWILKKKEDFVVPLSQILGMTLAGLWMVFGYYVAGGVMYGNFAVSAFSIPMNMIQFIMGFLVAALLTAALSKTPIKKYFAANARA